MSVNEVAGSGSVVLYGAPFSAGVRSETSFADDQRIAPKEVRKALTELMSGFNIPLGFTDCGDIGLGQACDNSAAGTADQSVEVVLSAVQNTVAAAIKNSQVPIILGGAHTLTLGSLRALKSLGRDYTLIYFDAHPDLMPHPQINYGSSLRYAVNERVLDPKRLVLLGVRQIEEEEERFIRERGIRCIEPVEFIRRPVSEIIEDIRRNFGGPYYFSIDLDALDPAFAPGVTTPFPLGLAPREVLLIVEELCNQPVLGLEIVELAPSNDRNSLTARLAGAILHSTALALEKSLKQR